MTPRITTHLWFDKEAREAARLYTSLFKGSKVKDTTTLEGTPSGSVDIVTIDLAGQEFTLLSAGPLFKFTPAVSFLVACATKGEVDETWSVLSKGGSTLMELGSYPFSERYGWLQDRYGLSWQIMFAGDRPIRQKITPVLMFVGDVSGKAESAIKFYTSVFGGAQVGDIRRHDPGGPELEGTIKFATFTLDGVEFAAMDSAGPHAFTFNEAISFMVHCETQEDIDSYWGKLSARPEAEQCGWLKDKFGLSWQIVPNAMDDMLKTKDRKKLARVTEAFLKMKKFDIKTLERTFRGD
ncbi:MAG TPA: VOC family protein [Patescibacteria group bacterium]|nr:VOC family protein [Patescibacteria group bacterium]